VSRKAAAAPALEKRPQPGRLRAVFLAVAVHVAFFALIVFGVTWQSKPAPPVQAELWDKLPPAPVAKAVEPKLPEPEPPKPEPAPPKPPEAKPEPPRPDPAIAQKLEREQRAKEKKQKEEEARKKREQEEAAKKKRDDEKRKVEEEHLRREVEKAREAAAAEKQSEVDRYKRMIHDRIRARANVPDTVTGNPEVHVLIRVLPGGEVLDITITRRSGNPTYDAAIERGIRSAQPLPVPPADSELFPQFRDLNLNFKHER
jgi:colicin import membrane protein